MSDNILEEKRLGDWNTVSELEDFAIVKTAPKGLLGSPMTDVLFTYKLKTNQKQSDQKKLHLYGEEGIVYKRALSIIERKKNPQAAHNMEKRFVHEFKTTKFMAQDHFFGSPHTLLGRAISQTGTSTRQFAEKTGIKSATLYHHVRGGKNSREISRDVAIEYAKKLNCDPVDLMFEKKSIPVWSKCNLLKSTALEDDYAPGRLFSYAADENLETVVVPRDIFRSDIKAIKVEAKGSMYNNKIAFYYRGTEKEQNILNQLCVVGLEALAGPEEFTDATEERFYFGLYEENQGESNLLNPDPFAKEKYILKNFEPLFVSPIILVLNPDAVVDQTKLKNKIPEEATVRQEELLRSEMEVLKAKYKKEAEQKAEAMKYAEYSVKAKKAAEQTLKKISEEQEKATQELMNKIKEVQKQIENETMEAKKSLFSKATRAPVDAALKIIHGGKK
ncbi:DNA binding protein [Candidatus Pelagibacter giovannonii]|uniref:DNA binding protein n=1 Tax=Candidatus Pelagibacter giovannonii TaxID=2563896 RepID=A0A6H1Q5R7_9PROT|nr:hypothetical protein [Candidatus Pelagibacter giovannonii]QIZ21555.1 DNA binding protein [Candidatus Pelagibacter giovannonii]